MIAWYTNSILGCDYDIHCVMRCLLCWAHKLFEHYGAMDYQKPSNVYSDCT